VRLPQVGALRLGQPDRQQLPRVVPLVQRLGRGEPLVALQPDQRRVQRGGQCLGRLGLPDAGLALQQDRLAQPYRQEQRGGQRVVGQVAGGLKRRPKRRHVRGQAHGRPPAGPWPPPSPASSPPAKPAAAANRSGSARNACRQPGAQKYHRRPACSALRLCGETATVMPHTGSVASTGAGDAGPAGSTRRDTSSARMDTAISPGVRAPMSRPAGVLIRCASAGDRASSASTAAPRLGLATSATYGTPAASAARSTSGSLWPWEATTTAAASGATGAAGSVVGRTSNPAAAPTAATARAIGVSPNTCTSAA